MLLIFVVMLVVMQKYVKPRVQGEQIVKQAFPEFSTEDFIQNLEYELRNIHLADTSLQVQPFATCDLTETVKSYRNVVDCSICRILFTEAQEFTGQDVIGAEVKLRLMIDDLLKKGFRERQDYPGGFSVHQWEGFTYEEEKGLLFLVIRAEEVPEGLAVTVSVLDENGEALQQQDLIDMEVSMC